MFRGSFEHSIDDKGRLAIPSKFRDKISDSGQAMLILTIFDQCLAAYTADEWMRVEDRISKMEQLDPNVRAFQRYFIGSAMECPVDKAGRILIPNGLRDLADIKKDCVIAGQLTKFEIWSQDRWHQMFSSISSRFSELTSGLAKVGMNL